MRVKPAYARYEPGGGFRSAPESGIVCGVCGYDVGSDEKFAFWMGMVCHAACVAEIVKEDVDDA